MAKHYLIGDICRKCPRSSRNTRYPLLKLEGEEHLPLRCNSWRRFADSWAYIKVEVPQDCDLYLEYVFNEHKNEEVEDLEIEL